MKAFIYLIVIFGIQAVGCGQQKIGKLITVTGSLRVDSIPPIAPGEPQRQQLTGNMYTIRKPKWKLVNPE